MPTASRRRVGACSRSVPPTVIMRARGFSSSREPQPQYRRAPYGSVKTTNPTRTRAYQLSDVYIQSQRWGVRSNRLGGRHVGASRDAGFGEADQMKSKISYAVAAILGGTS